LVNGIETAENTLKKSCCTPSSNPVPYIVGALGLGIVIGLLIPRETPKTSLLEGRVDELKDLLGSLKSRLSTTAGEGYEDVSATISDVVKKARKRFNLS